MCGSSYSCAYKVPFSPPQWKFKLNLIFVFLSFFALQQIKDELCEVVSEMEALDVPEDKHSNKDKQMSIGRKKFNMDPKKGELKKSCERKKCHEKDTQKIKDTDANDIILACYNR